MNTTELTPDEEIKELGNMLFATSADDAPRLRAIANRALDFANSKPEPKGDPAAAERAKAALASTELTDACYDKAEAIVTKFRREDLRNQAEKDELDALCRKFELALREIASGATSDPSGTAKEALTP